MHIKHLGFKAAVAFLFAILLATYGFYWLSISQLNYYVVSLVRVSNHLKNGETLHSAIHDMILEARDYYQSGRDPAFLARYEYQTNKAVGALRRLQRHVVQMEPGPKREAAQEITQGMARSFEKFRHGLDLLMGGERGQEPRRLHEAMEIFNSLFQKYYMRLHNHHAHLQEEASVAAARTWRTTTIVFIIQLVLAGVAGLLVILYLDRVVLKVFLFTERMAYQDKLTGLFNRAALAKFAESRDAAGGQERRRYSLIMLDIDFFKQFNDTHGHQAGDKLLADLAALMSAQVRGPDRVVRYGGEEFLVELPETGPRDGAQVAEKLRAAIGQNQFVLPGGEAAPRVTVSLGVAAYPDDGDSFKEIVKKADERLYQAKEQGRNRVVG